jgi:hypothetical protein
MTNQDNVVCWWKNIKTKTNIFLFSAISDHNWNRPMLWWKDIILLVGDTFWSKNAEPKMLKV